MKITSTAFEANGRIPAKYTCQGKNINPPFIIEGVPKGSQSLVLVMDDPDAPMVNWDHWIVFDMPPDAHIEENSVPGRQGKNSWGRVGYGGPCPPSGTHRYFFKVYALDALLKMPEGADKASILKTMKGHVLGTGELIGLYSKS